MLAHKAEFDHGTQVQSCGKGNPARIGFKACVAAKISDALVAPAFRRALLIQVHARLKASATGADLSLSHRLFILFDLGYARVNFTEG
jgi:hypothetical protein